MTASQSKALSKDFPVTHRSVLAIAVPMTFAYLTTPLVGLADTWTIGQLGDAALIGAVAIGGIIFDILFTTMNFLRTGTTGLVAQALGAGNQRAEVAIFARAVIIAIAIGLVALVAQDVLLTGALWFLGGTDAVQEAVATYFGVRVLGAPFALGNYAILGYLLGRGEAYRGLALQTLLNVTNISLNIWFVLHLGWGVEGVAFASILAEMLAFLVGGTALLWRFSKLPKPTWSEIVDRAEVQRMFSVNRDIMIRSFALLFAFATFTRLSAAQGEVILAANAILQKYFLIAGYFLDGTATAAEQLVGRAKGALRRTAFVRAVRLCALWTALFALAVSSVFFLGGEWLLAAMTPDEEVRAVGRIYLLFASLTPIVGAAAFLMDGIFIGATWTRTMRNMMLLSLAIYLISAYAAVAYLGNTGLWLAFLMFLGIRGLTLGAVLPRRINETFGPVERSGSA